eukprot:m.387249 g.387249  ORF g.387249 m.387249 type:complete len:678 (+) comp56312_c0_seq3:31-2064(+)
MENEDKLKIRKLENVWRVRARGVRGSGTVLLFATHFIFVDTKGHETWVQYMKIEALKRKGLTPDGTPLEVTTKDFNWLSLVFPREAEFVLFFDTLTALTTISTVSRLPAFTYKQMQAAHSLSTGHLLYDPVKEFQRMGVPCKEWSVIYDNNDFSLCSTYGRVLALPSLVAKNQAIVKGSARFRSRGRLPALTFLYWNKAAICRCSQPMSGVQGKRAIEDENLVAAIHSANPNGLPTIIIDTRPKVNAMANRAGGKGYENIEGYPNCSLVFQPVHNIHVMRDSLNTMLDVFRSGESKHLVYTNGLESCGWLKHVRAVLETAIYTANMISTGHSCIVHCSDGWDRTSQTCSLAALLLDPHYRTILGFIMLIEKDWLSFGHKFVERNSFLERGSKEASPIFLQFLECTWHIMRQFPRAFEFNEHFLISIYDCVQSCEFGTFLGDCERDRYMARVADETVSIWSHLLPRSEDFKNPLYDIGTGEIPHQGALLLDLHPQLFEVWTSMYCRYEPVGTLPRQDTTQAAMYLRVKADTADRQRRNLIDVIRRKEEELRQVERLTEHATSLVEAKNTEAIQDLLAELLSLTQSTAAALPHVPPSLQSPLSTDQCHGCSRTFAHLETKRSCFACGFVHCVACADHKRPLTEFGLKQVRQSLLLNPFRTRVNLSRVRFCRNCSVAVLA